MRLAGESLQGHSFHPKVKMITFHTCHGNPMGHQAGVNSPSQHGREPWFWALVEFPGKGRSVAG